MSTDSLRAGRGHSTHKGQVKKMGEVKTGQSKHRQTKSQKTGSRKIYKQIQQASSGRYQRVVADDARNVGDELIARVSKTLRNIAAHTSDTVTAAQLRNQVGGVLQRVMMQGSVTITRHNRPSAVMLSIDVYESLLRSAQSPLNTLTAEFDALVAQMQTEKSKQAARSLFTATPAELGKAAAAAARSRG